MSVRPHVLIQQHPTRQHLLPRIVRKLDGLPYTVVRDDGPGRPDPWRGYRACLELADNLDATHAVILQDDAIPCFDFACWLNCRIEEEPDAILVLFLAAQPRLTAAAATQALRARQVFASLHARDFMPAVGVSWPIGIARDVVEWAGSHNGRTTRSDDHMLGQWHRAAKTKVLVTVPSLVQHPDDVPSLVGNGNGAGGRNPARVALHWDG